jgi:uncharacterized membrane protein YccF (DUF307 family)
MIEEYISNLFLGEEKYRHLVEFVVFTFFCTLAAILIIAIWNSIKGDRYLSKRHYKYWKLTKGTIAQRKQATRNPVTDPLYDKLLNRMTKLWNILLGIWLSISVIVALIIVAIDKLV